MAHELAGKKAPKSMLVNVPRLISSYYLYTPDVGKSAQKVEFGTSGHRGSSMKMSFNEFGVHDWLSKLVSDLEPTANRENVKLTLSPRTAVEDITIVGDQDRLNQVIINLVENAIKYNRPGGRVDVGYAKLGHSIKIHVSDTGNGIESEHISRLFERFYRVDKERSRAVGGTGLGLAIVKHIVEAHKSKIEVESEVGVGSTFSFCLRRKE